MKIFKVLVVAIGVVFLALIGVYAYLGGFKAVEVERGSYGPVEIIYTTHKGPYEKIGESWEHFKSDWQKAGLKKCDSLAIYLDPPETPPEQLRSILACNLEGLSEEQKSTLQNHFGHFVVPEMAAMVSSFPYKNMMSFMVAPMRVYPQLMQAMEKENLGAVVAMEVYGPIDEIEHIRLMLPFGIDKSSFQSLYEAFE